MIFIDSYCNSNFEFVIYLIVTKLNETSFGIYWMVKRSFTLTCDLVRIDLAKNLLELCLKFY